MRNLKKVAHLYYEKNMNQKEIADIVDVSRSQISRMLTEAKNEGIVKITILDTVDSCEHLEESLKKYFGLKDAIVVPTTSYIPDMIRQVVGQAAANYLNSIIKSNQKIGVSWGISVYEMIKSMKSLNLAETTGVEVVQLIGGLGQTSTTLQSFSLVNQLSNILEGQSHLMHAPGFVSNSILVDNLKKDKEIGSILEKAKNIDIALMGLDALWKHRSLVQVDNLTEADLELLEKNGAVGQSCFRFYDIQGNICSQSIDDRVLSISLNDLKNIETVIGVATSLDTTEAILGGLRNGFLDVLVSDEKTVEEIIFQQEDFLEQKND